VVIASAIHQRVAALAQQLANSVAVLDHFALQVHGSSSAPCRGAWSGPSRGPMIGLAFTARPLHANSRGTTPASVSTREVSSRAQRDRGAGTESARRFHLSSERCSAVQEEQWHRQRAPETRPWAPLVLRRPALRTPRFAASWQGC